MVQVAVCGAGNWGRNVVRAFGELPDAHLRYICDLNPTVRQRMAAQYPTATVTDDLDKILNDPQVDAVVAAVDVPRHYAVAHAALSAGKHVLVEKPLTLNAQEAQQLIELAELKHRKLMVGHLLEYHPAVQYMKRMLAEGELEPLYCYSQRLNLGVVRQSENAWWSLAPHDISVVCYLLGGEPVSVTATGQCYLQRGVEDVVFANLRFADGRMAHIHVSWLDPHKLRKVTVVGSNKMVVFDDMESVEKVRVYDKCAQVKPGVEGYPDTVTLRQGDCLIPAIPNLEPLRIECAHFVECIVNDKTPRSDGEDGLRVVRVLEAGSASLARGGEPVAVGAADATDAADVTDPVRAREGAFSA